MTSLRALMADIPVPADTHVPVRAAAARPSESAMRLALRLREERAGSAGRALVFVPASSGADASLAARDAASGLTQLGEGPVLLMDLRTKPGEWTATASLPPDIAHDDDAEDLAHETIRPFAHCLDPVPYAASAEFAARFAEARKRYAYVLCIGDALDTSVQTLITAGMSDGVVLSVTPGITTRAEMTRTTDHLRHARAQVLGFVMDERRAEEGAP